MTRSWLKTLTVVAAMGFSALATVAEAHHGGGGFSGGGNHSGVSHMNTLRQTNYVAPLQTTGGKFKRIQKEPLRSTRSFTPVRLISILIVPLGHP